MSLTSTSPTSPFSTQTPPPPPTHLILVCCHAIYTPSTHPQFKSQPRSQPYDSTSTNSWLLAPFQKDEIPTFTTHIITGLRLLLANLPHALLVFSGSKTRREIDLSEARSYLALCEDARFWGLLNESSHSDEDATEIAGHVRPTEAEVKERIVLEEQALDSFANLLLGVLAFWRRCGSWPEEITIVSHGFKRERFMGLHVPALGLPVGRVRFVGVDPGYMVPGEGGGFDEERAREVRRGERERGFGAWEGDRWGVGEVLRGKRRARNFWGVGQMLFVDEAERRRSGLKTRVLEGEIVEEVLDSGVKFPWGESYEGVLEGS